MLQWIRKYWWLVVAMVMAMSTQALAEAGFLNLLGEVGGGIATGGLSTILGGITGVFGSWLNNRHAVKVKALDQTHQRAMMAENRTTSRMEAENALKQTVVITTGAIDTALAKGRESNLQQANVPDDILGMVNALKSGFFKGYCVFLLVHIYMLVKLIRPAVTIYLLALASMFMGKVFVLMQTQGDLDQILTDSGGALIMYTANALFYFIGVCIGYYFQERNRIAAPVGYAFASPGAPMASAIQTPPQPDGAPTGFDVPAGSAPSAEDDEVPVGELP